MAKIDSLKLLDKLLKLKVMPNAIVPKRNLLVQNEIQVKWN